MKPVLPEVTAAVVEAPAIAAVAGPQSFTLLHDLVMLTKARLTLLVFSSPRPAS